MGSTTKPVRSEASPHPPAQVVGSGAVLGLCAALFGTSEVVALMSFLRPHAWRAAGIGETLAVTLRVLGSSAIPAMACSMALLAWAGSAAVPRRLRRASIYAMAIGGGALVVIAGLYIFAASFPFVRGYSFTTGVREGLTLFLLAALPSLAAAIVSDRWSRQSTERIWRFRLVKAMNVGSALLLSGSFVMVAITQFSHR